MPAPLGDELILDALRATGGTAIAVDDTEILADLADFGAREASCCARRAPPELARHLREQGWLSPGTRSSCSIRFRAEEYRLI